MSAADRASAAGAPVRPYHFPAGERGITILIDDSRDALLTDFGRATLRDRYLLPGENFQDMFARVACANSDEVVLGVDTERGADLTSHAQRLYDYISRLWFMPATPVLTNSGVSRGLPISCFLNLVGDSMGSIAEAAHENIWLAAKGGGIGTCWSPVRSINEPIAGSLTGKTSGVIPFIHWSDAQTLAISQGSLRRGSGAAYLDDRHPEIEEFIDIRRPVGGDPRRKAHNLHHGIMLSDDFMNAVTAETAEERVWDLRSPQSGETIRSVDARDLWIKILTTRLETGEPYIIFADNVNNRLPAIYESLGLKVQQSNLCSEITLHTGEDHLGNWRTAVCCLSSLVMDTADQWFGDEVFVEDVLRFLDNVLERFIEGSAEYPGFERARYSAMRERSVGLGMMGFHSYLQSKGIPFESKQAQGLNTRMWQWLRQTADQANEMLALERGECPDSADAREINPVVSGKRLTHVFSIAPTASISIIAGGSSPCGEPWPANSFTQKTLSGSFNVRNPHLDRLLRSRYEGIRKTIESAPLDMQYVLNEDPRFKSVMSAELEEWLEDQWQSITINDGSVQHMGHLSTMEKATFKTAFEIDQRWVIRHHADRAEFVCQAQSVNVFLASTVHKKDLHEVHKLAWELGLKSLYYLRSRTASKAMAVSHVAGEMPEAKIEASGPVYVDEPECLACQ